LLNISPCSNQIRDLVPLFAKIDVLVFKYFALNIEITCDFLSAFYAFARARRSFCVLWRAFDNARRL